MYFSYTPKNNKEFFDELEKNKKNLTKLYSITKVEVINLFSQYYGENLVNHLKNKFEEESDTIYFINRLDKTNQRILLHYCGIYTINYHYFFMWYPESKPLEMLNDYYSKSNDDKLNLINEYIKYCGIN